MAVTAKERRIKRDFGKVTLNSCCHQSKECGRLSARTFSVSPSFSRIDCSTSTNIRSLENRHNIRSIINTSSRFLRPKKKFCIYRVTQYMPVSIKQNLRTSSSSISIKRIPFCVFAIPFSFSICDRSKNGC